MLTLPQIQYPRIPQLSVVKVNLKMKLILSEICNRKTCFYQGNPID